MMTNKILDHSKKTSAYTYAGAYEDYLKSLPSSIPELGLLLCGQTTHPSMFYTEVSEYLENNISENSHPIKNIDSQTRMSYL